MTNGPQNWGKFCLGQFSADEWQQPSQVSPEVGRPLLRQIGWDDAHHLVLDLQTGEGAVFRLGGLASADLNKHKIWVCPLFEPFLGWLYAYRNEHVQRGDRRWFDDLPLHVDLPTAPFSLSGYRRQGPPP